VTPPTRVTARSTLRIARTHEKPASVSSALASTRACTWPRAIWMRSILTPACCSLRSSGRPERGGNRGTRADPRRRRAAAGGHEPTRRGRHGPGKKPGADLALRGVRGACCPDVVQLAEHPIERRGLPRRLGRRDGRRAR
jgi:hypothetical protein